MAASHGITSDVLEYRQALGLAKYRVSNRGDVQYHRIDGTWKSMGVSRSGKTDHAKVSLTIEGVRQPFHVHMLVLTTFVGPAPDGKECRHLNGNCRDNRVENLEWGTRLQNMHDKWDHGTMSLGEKNGCAKLAETNVIEIRHRHRSGESTNSLALEFNVSWATIYDVVRGRNWKHVPMPVGKKLGGKRSKLSSVEKRNVLVLSALGFSQVQIGKWIEIHPSSICHLLAGRGAKTESGQ